MQKAAPVSNLPLYLLLLAIPMGAGAQNAVQAICILWMGWLLWQRRETLSPFTDWKASPLFLTSTALGALIVWWTMTPVLNAANPATNMLAFFLGFLPMVVLPVMTALLYRDLPAPQLHALARLLTIVLLVMALACLTQMLWGWQRDGLAITEGSFRARAFFSHPLTLAYTVAVFWPLALAAVWQQPRNPWSIIATVAVFLCLWGSQSRVVLPLCLVVTFYQIVQHSRGRMRLAIVGAAILGLLAVAVTDNRVSRSFRQTFAGTLDRNTTAYADDRLAFWHAHWHLAKQRLILGHGSHMPKQTRIEAYEAIGLKDFPKKYSAHNQYLQILVEAGLVGVLLFVFWLFSLIKALCLTRDSWLAAALSQAWLVFALAIVTQNALQDNEVRLSLTIMLCLSGGVLLRPPSVKPT